VRAKPQIVVINKIDLTATKERLKEQADIFSERGVRVYPISAVTGEGTGELMKEIANKLAHLPIS